MQVAPPSPCALLELAGIIIITAKCTVGTPSRLPAAPAHAPCIGHVSPTNLWLDTLPLTPNFMAHSMDRKVWPTTNVISLQHGRQTGLSVTVWRCKHNSCQRMIPQRRQSVLPFHHTSGLVAACVQNWNSLCGTYSTTGWHSVQAAHKLD